MYYRTTSQNRYGTFSSPQKVLLFPFPVNWTTTLSLQPGNCFLISVPTVQFSFSWLSYKQNHTICILSYGCCSLCGFLLGEGGRWCWWAVGKIANSIEVLEQVVAGLTWGRRVEGMDVFYMDSVSVRWILSLFYCWSICGSLEKLIMHVYSFSERTGGEQPPIESEV